MNEIMEMNILEAHEQVEFYLSDEYSKQCERLQAHGIKVFDKDKGLSHYKEFFKHIEDKRIEREMKGKPKIKIDPTNNFLKG